MSAAAPVVTLGYNTAGTRLDCAVCHAEHDKAPVGVEYRTPAGDHVCDACGQKYADPTMRQLYFFLWDSGLADGQLWSADLADRIGTSIRNQIANRRDRKREKLKHYATRPLTTFVQLDGFHDGPAGGFDYEDTDGDELWSTSTDELMRGSTVRVLVDPKADPAVVARLLKKLTAWWERDGVELRAVQEIPF